MHRNLTIVILHRFRLMICNYYIYVIQASAATEYILRPMLSSKRQVNCIKKEDKGTTLYDNYKAQ